MARDNTLAMANQAETVEPSAAALPLSGLTPMLRQYVETKAQVPEAILFFRLGDFYEMFFEDAVRAADLLKITLTSRAKGADRIPMCGVPYHSSRRYIAKLIESGLQVAICDQVETPGAGPGLVRREVTRIITPGVVLDDEVLESGSHCFLAAVTVDPAGAAGVALLEASTGEFLAAQLPSVDATVAELSCYDVRELLVMEGAAERQLAEELCARLSRKPAVASIERDAFVPARAEALLQRHFQVATLEGFGLEDAPLATAAAGAALRYLQKTQRTDAPHVDSLKRIYAGTGLRLDEASLTNLEILRSTSEGGRRGSLLGVMDRTSTAMGARKLQRWLSAPLYALPEIHARLDAVEELHAKAATREGLGERLKDVADLERLAAKLCLGAGNGRDLLALARSLEVLPVLASQLETARAHVLSGMASPLRALAVLQQALAGAMVDEPPVTVKDGGLFRKGFHPTLDQLIELSTSGKEVLLGIESRERDRTGISSLKVRYNKVFGYFIEVTKPNLHLVPKDYTRKQTTVGAERFVTEELKTYEEQVLTAEERRAALELELFEQLRAKVSSHASQLRAAAEAVATVDVLVSFARVAAQFGYVRPTVDDSETIEILKGRHPVVERMLPTGAFVPNDLVLSCDDAQLLVITGPNMAGKSTVMRQVALIALLAQAGSFVPAERARIGLCDRIFTRVGAADNLARGQSTFMVEMAETSNILHHATRKSLIVLDEIGRGTSTYDGLSIAWSVAEHLHDKIGARTLFATHYHELAELDRERRRVKNYSVSVKETRGKITFLRRLIPEAANRSYGIEVARLAGLPKEVLERARTLLATLERGAVDDLGHAVLGRSGTPSAGSSSQLALFGEAPRSSAAQGVIDALKALAVDELTPIAALNLLAEWQRTLRG